MSTESSKRWDLARLELFAAVADLGSLTRVAAARSSTQPVISRQIAALERECGGRLFARTGRGMTLTELGQRLLPRIKAMLDEAKQLSEEIGAAGGVAMGEVRIGALPSLYKLLICPLFRVTQERFPKVQLHVFEGSAGQIDEWIATNWPSLPPESVELHGTSGRIMFRRRGYRILPHRDPKWSFLTCILYLARRGDDESWGTQLYAVDEDREATSAAPYWIDEQHCRLVEDVAFRPNRLLVFLNSVGAHGASIPADAQPANLERYIYQFRVGPTPDAIAMLKSMLPEERRPLWTGKASVDY